MTSNPNQAEQSQVAGPAAIEGINSALSREAEELTRFRENCKAIHGSGDVPAAGDEVEISTRDKLASKFKSKYYVTHGHLIDCEWHNSKQLDFIIADLSSAPIIFRSQRTMEYVPYEAVYAVGEIKSTFSFDGLEEFCDKLKHLDESVHRERVPGDVLSLGGEFITDPRLKNRQHLVNFTV